MILPLSSLFEDSLRQAPRSGYVICHLSPLPWIYLFLSQQHGEFRCTAKAIYRITEDGRRLARWDSAGQAKESPNSSSVNVNTLPRTSEDATAPGEQDPKLVRRISMSEKLNQAVVEKKKGIKESNTDRLKYIIEEPSLRSKFRDFLRDNFCEENLSFWLDVEDFRHKFSTTSSAHASNLAPARVQNKSSPGQAAMERHHESLVQMAFVIYNTYLAPSSQCELNIDHALRNELSAYLSDVMTGLTGKAFQGRVEPEHAAAFNATQLQTMINLYTRIQQHVFRLMANDSVPKVCNRTLLVLIC